MQCPHTDIGEEGKGALRAYDAVGNDVEGIVVGDKRTDIEPRDILNRILIPDALREVCIFPHLIAQGLYLLEKLRMTPAERFPALRIAGIEDGTVGKDDACTEHHVVAVGMHATAHARSVVDNYTADHSTAYRSRIGREDTAVRLQDIVHAPSRDTGLEGDGVCVIIQMVFLPAFPGHNEHGVGTTLPGERCAGSAERKGKGILLAGLEGHPDLLLVLRADDDLWGHAVEAGICSPGIGAEAVSIYLSLRDDLPNLGKKLLLDMWVDHNNVACLLLQR